MLHLRNEPNIDELLASAKAAERAGLVAQAVRRYRAAFALIARKQANYPAETFARLPIMLNDAGLKNEAWYEFCELLVKGCPGRNTSEHAAVWNDRAALFDKMRSFLQHENEHINAVICGVLFFVARVIACQHQPERCHPKALRSIKTARGLLLPLLRRAGKADALPWIASELQTLVRAAPPDMIEQTTRVLSSALRSGNDHDQPHQGRYPLPSLHYFRAEIPITALQAITPATT